MGLDLDLCGLGKALEEIGGLGVLHVKVERSQNLLLHINNLRAFEVQLGALAGFSLGSSLGKEWGTDILAGGRVVSDVGEVAEVRIVALFVLAPKHEGRHPHSCTVK